MSETLRDLLNTLKDLPNLVVRFKDLLAKNGVALRQDARWQHFIASKSNKSIFVLAHESTKDKWWGVNKRFIEGLKNSATNPQLQLAGWGIALIDGEPRRGYWIEGENLLGLINTMALRPDGQGKYHFHGDQLDQYPNLALRFFTIDRFLELSGLNNQVRESNKGGCVS